MYKIAINDNGRAIYATSFIPEGKLVMRCPLIKFDHKETMLLSKTLLAHYIFNWGNGCCLPLGYALLMNHSAAANIGWDEKGETEFLFIATRDIAIGEELCIDYGYPPSSYKDSGVQGMFNRRLNSEKATVRAADEEPNFHIKIQTVIRDALLGGGKTTAQRMFVLVRKQYPTITVSMFTRAWKDLINQEYLVLVSGKDYRWEGVA